MNDRQFNIISCVIEVCLCILILSLVFSIVSTVNPFGADQFAKDILQNALGEHSAAKYWFQLLYGHFTFELVGNGLYGMIFAAFTDSVIISFCIRVCKEIAGRIKEGMVALPTLLGVILGCELITILANTFGDGGTVMKLVVEIVILMIGILIMTRTSLPAFNISGLGLTLLKLLPDAFAASAVLEYLIALGMVCSKQLEPPIPWIAGSSLVTIVVLILVYILDYALDACKK